MARLLLMEDDLELSFTLAEGLRAHGFEVDAVAGARDAEPLLAGGGYDLLITDIIVYEDGRPVPDGGFSLIHWLRQRERHQDIPAPPIICISGTPASPGMQHFLKTAEQLGADATFEKPVDIDALADAVHRLLAA